MGCCASRRRAELCKVQPISADDGAGVASLATRLAAVRGGYTPQSIFDRMKYPMWVVPAASLMDMTEAKPHQTLRALGLLACVDSLSGDVIFISHQWCAFKHPDPRFVQLGLLQGVLRQAAAGTLRFKEDAFSKIIYGVGKGCTLKAKDREALLKCSVWYDYFSVPQPEAPMAESDQHTDLKSGMGQAIASLQHYIAVSRYFIVLAPVVKHTDKAGVFLDYVSWKDRGWCRLERMARVLSPLHTSILLASREDVLFEVGAQDYLLDPVCEGTFTVDADRHTLGEIVMELVTDRQQRLLQLGEVEQYRLLTATAGGLLRGAKVSPAASDTDVVAKFVQCTCGQAVETTEFVGTYGYDSAAMPPEVLPPLLMAALAGNHKAVAGLLDQKASILERNRRGMPEFLIDQGMNALHVAAKFGHVQVVEELLARGVDPDARAREWFGKSPVHFCSAGGHAAVAELLLRGRADMAQRNAVGDSALVPAVQFNRPAAFVDLLLRAGVPCGANPYGLSALHFAAIFGTSPGAVTHLARRGAPADGQMDHGWSPPGTVSFIWSLPHRLWWSRSFFPVFFYHIKGATPIMLAAALGRFREADEFLACGADTTVRNARGLTAADLARLFDLPVEHVAVFRGQRLT